MEAVAASGDGRALVFEAPVGTPLSPGDVAVVETAPQLFAQVTSSGLAVRSVDGRVTPEGGGDVPATWARPPQ